MKAPLIYIYISRADGTVAPGIVELYFSCRISAKEFATRRGFFFVAKLSAESIKRPPMLDAQAEHVVLCTCTWNSRDCISWREGQWLECERSCWTAWEFAAHNRRRELGGNKVLRAFQLLDMAIWSWVICRTY